MIVEHRNDGLTITVPKRRMPLWLALLVSFGLFVFCVVPVFAGTVASAATRVSVVVGLIAIVTFVVALRRFLTWHRQPPDWEVAFDVRNDTLLIRWRGTDGEALSDVFRREDVVSIRGDLFRMGLTIRIRGRTIMELLHDRPKVLRVWIAGALCRALGLSDESARREG